MRNTRLTGRERVNRMFKRQDHDCVPRSESMWDETLERWRKEGLNCAPLEFIGCDFQPTLWSDPRPFPGRNETVAEDETTRTYIDEWGNTVRYFRNKSTTPEHIAFGCQTRDDWERIYKPKLYASRPFAIPDIVRQHVAVGRRLGRWTFYCGLEAFEMARRQVGDECFLISMIEDPEWAMDISRTFADIVMKDFDNLWELGVETDGVWIYGDMAYRRGPMCGPAMYRELVWPDHKRLAGWAHDHDVPFIFHTDGDVNTIIEDYIDAGFDCLQPLEAKAGMDVREMAPKYGDRLALFGNIDVMVMATNDRELIDNEVRTKLAAGMATKGYAYHSDHSVPPTVSLETYRFILDLVDRYGNYD